MKSKAKLIMGAVTIGLGLGMASGCGYGNAETDTRGQTPSTSDKPVQAKAGQKKTYTGLTAFDHMAETASKFGKGRVNRADKQGNIFIEAEEFQLAPGETPGAGWLSKDWGENYYAATFAISFLSRKAFLGAPENGPRTVAVSQVEIPTAGKYLALVRYEAAFRFETQFTLQIEQAGKVVFSRLYGARDNIKIWPFRGMGGLKTEVGWYWGAVENTVWEGHEAFADLAAGPATIRLIADKQPEPAAKRNVDLVMLTMDKAGVDERIAKEGYLPLDGLLTQEGDLLVRVTNPGTEVVKVLIKPGQEHSPYWVHMRKWKPLNIEVAPGGQSPWLDAGALLDSMNDGQWAIAATGATPQTPAPAYTLEFAVVKPDGTQETIFKRENVGPAIELAYDANTRYTRRLRETSQVLPDLVAYLKSQPFDGKVPVRTPIYYYGFKPIPGNEPYNKLLREFWAMYSGTHSDGRQSSVYVPGIGARGYIDVRGEKTQELAQSLATKFPGEQAKGIRVVSLGDEIGLEAPKPGPETDKAYHAWAKARGYKPSQLSDGAGDDWSKVHYDPDPKKKEAAPGPYYYSSLYKFEHGINHLKERTDIIRKALPNADTGANFSPHHGAPYLGSAYQFITLFRKQGMTMPWGEDYIWQVPVGSQQMNSLQIDMFRAGVRYQPKPQIHFYVMPHTPGNTVNSWRRLFYSALGSGMTMVNLFEFNPVQVAYTENHTSNPEMYQAVRTAFGELGKFEDIVQDGKVRDGNAAIWYSLAGDVWQNHAGNFGPEKRSLYVAALHQQLQVDVVDEDDALIGTLNDYKLLFLADKNVSTAASKAIAEWVSRGGRVFATAGAGMYDEYNRPNLVLQSLFGVKQSDLKDLGNIPILLEKQDLPFSNPVAKVSLTLPSGKFDIDAFGVISSITATDTGKVIGTFADGKPAVVTSDTGKGKTIYCAFMPALSYFKPAIPKLPVDRGSTDDAMAHFIPTTFDPGAKALIGLLAADLDRPVTTSSDLVQADVIQSKTGAVVTLTNWSPTPANGLEVTIHGKDIPTSAATLASGRPVKVVTRDGKKVFVVDIAEADALILK